MMLRPRHGAVAVVAALLAGCLAPAERGALGVHVPDHYREARPAPAPALQAEWWRAFRSPALSGYVARGMDENLDIRIAVAQIVQAEAQAGIAAAPLYPSLSATASAQTARSAATALSPPSTRQQYALGLTAGYMLDFWGKNRSGLLAAEENALAARFNREVVTLSTQVTIANTTFQVLAAHDQLAVARRNLAAANRILQLVRQQFAAGTVSQLDVSQQEALVATVRASIPPLEITARQNTAALAVLLGRAPADMPIPSGGLAPLAVPRVAPGLPSDLLTRRPDIQLAEAQMEAARLNVQAARAAMFPQVQLTATGGIQSAALQSLFGPGAWYYSLVAGLTQPIFDGFLLQNQLEQARGVQLQALETYRKAVLSAFADVEKALVAVHQTGQQARLQGEVVASTRRAFTIAEVQFRGGTATLISVLQAQQSMFAAENTLVQVRLARLLAATSLYQALGGGWNAR